MAKKKAVTKKQPSCSVRPRAGGAWAPAPSFVYQFKITQVDTHPVIWRRIQTADCKLHTLHHLKRSGPPEDCGGPHIFEHILEVLANRRHKEHAEVAEAYGGFDLENFDAKRATLRMVNGVGA